MSEFPEIIIKPEKTRALQGKHPWVFSGAIERIRGNPQAGDIVDVVWKNGDFIGRGYYNPKTSIAVRLLTFKKDNLDANFFRKKILEAYSLRKNLIPDNTDSFRLINGEGDFLPGLVIDKFANAFVCQFLTAGMERLKKIIIEQLIAIFKPKFIWEDGSQHSRAMEGLSRESKSLFGEPREIEILENGLKFFVAPCEGQKTGFFLDQRSNREFAGRLSKDLNSGLDAFCYTGAFSSYMLSAGLKKVISLDASETALMQAEKNFLNNGFSNDRFEIRKADVFNYLREMPEKSFDIIVLDPPALAKKNDDILKASAGYKEINLQAFGLIKRGGYLCTFSCSPHIDMKLFVQIVFAAMKDSGREAKIIHKSHHGFDHPQSLAHPEGEYLKGLFLQVL